MKNVIVIPVYRSLRSTERISYIQALRIFKSEDIVILTFKRFDTKEFVSLAKSEGVNVRFEYFPKRYFLSVQGYNHLTLSRGFYERFKQYNYMLIYQLDAYVFKNDLKKWCELGYDYIGAPTQYDSLVKPTSFLMNGGLSLRKVKTFIEAYKDMKWYKLAVCCMTPTPRKWLVVPKIIMSCLQAFVCKHNMQIFFYNLTHEDLFWSRTPFGKRTPFCVALDFAFETNCEKSYSIIKHLPFGCHAWEKYEPEFWKKYIK